MVELYNKSDLTGTWITHEKDGLSLKIGDVNSQFVQKNLANLFTMEEVQLIIPDDAEDLTEDELIEASEQRMLKAQEIYKKRPAQETLDLKRKLIAFRVIGWRDVTENGNPIPFAIELVISLLENYPKYEKWLEDNIVKLNDELIEKAKKRNSAKKK